MASTAQIIRALVSGDRMALIIALRPEAADVIPRGPLRSEFIAARSADYASLNPQPLPPEGIVVGVRLMNKLVTAALASEKGFNGHFARDLDDWCGTGWPHRWPWPVPDPDPNPWYLAQVQLGGMVALAEIAAHYDNPEVVEVLDKAIEMLGDAAVTQL
jgi:hypothetical protein